MTALRQRIRQSSEIGATAAEYAGAIIAAVILVLALIVAATPIGERLACEVGSAIDRITGGEGYTCESTSGTNSQYEVDPAEVAKTTTERTKSTDAGVDVKVGPGSLGIDGKDSVSANKTENYDGSGSRSVRRTQELSGEYSLGAETGDGDDGGDDDNPFSAAVKGSGGVSISRTEKDTWKCGGEGQRSCDEFDEANDEAIDSKLDHQGAGRIGHDTKEVDQEPDVKSTSTNVKLTLDGKASASAAGAGASVSVSGEAGYTYTETVVKDGDGDGDDRKETSHRFTYKGQVGAGIDEGTFGMSVDGNKSYAGSYEVTYDEDGNLKTITFKSVAEGTMTGNAADGDLKAGVTATSTVTTTLDVSSLSADERKVAEEYVSSSMTNGALTVPEAALNPSSPSENEFDNLLYEHAKVTRVTEEGKKITNSGGIDLWVVHWTESEETTTSTTTRVEVLDEPGTDGTRSYKESELP